MPANQQQQMPEQPMSAELPAPRTSTEQPRPVEPMSVESMRMRGGDGEGEAVCCGVCAGLCCFECCECCC